MEKSERRLIEWIGERTRADASVAIGVGDDMAMVMPGVDGVLLTCDMLMDGVDFETAKHSPRQIGRKAMAASLSDCAAMAVQPRWALLSVALPEAWSMAQAQELFEGAEGLAREHGVSVVGGDTNSWRQGLVVDVTVAATPWPGLMPVRRSGMKSGDIVLVSGRLGGSILGHHLEFEPRVETGKRLREVFGESLHAMMDLSDGLSIDARRMAEASGCGIELREGDLLAAASAAAMEMAESDGRSVLDHVMDDGEDFELLFAVEPTAWRKHGFGADLGSVMFEVGTAFGEAGLWLVKGDGERSAVEAGGWQHFTNR